MSIDLRKARLHDIVLAEKPGGWRYPGRRPATMLCRISEWPSARARTVVVQPFLGGTAVALWGDPVVVGAADIHFNFRGSFPTDYQRREAMASVPRDPLEPKGGKWIRLSKASA